MAFFLGRNLVFLDSMQFMNSTLDKLVKNLLDEDFTYLVEEFGPKKLEILIQKGAYPYELFFFREKLIITVKYQMVT